MSLSRSIHLSRMSYSAVQLRAFSTAATTTTNGASKITAGGESIPLPGENILQELLRRQRDKSPEEEDDSASDVPDLKSPHEPHEGHIPDLNPPKDVPQTRHWPPKEVGGRDGPEPTRYGDWESKGRCVDF